MAWRPIKIRSTSQPSAYELWSLTTPPIAEDERDGGINWNLGMMRLGSGLLNSFDWAEDVIDWVDSHIKILGDGLTPIPGIATKTIYYRDLFGNELGDVIRANTTVRLGDQPVAWGQGVEIEHGRDLPAVTKRELQKEGIKIAAVTGILFLISKFGVVVPATALATSAKAGANVFYKSQVLAGFDDIARAVRKTHEPILPEMHQAIDDLEATIEPDDAMRQALVLLMQGLDNDSDTPLKEGISLLTEALNSDTNTV